MGPNEPCFVRHLTAHPQPLSGQCNRDEFLECIQANQRGTLTTEPLALAYLFGDRISGVIQSAERGITLVVVIVAVALAVVAFFSFRRRRIQMLDQDPEALFENREIIFGPAADRIADAVRLGEVEGKTADHRSANKPRE